MGISEIKELFQIVFFIIAGYVALSGLSAWKKEHIGKAYYDLAKKLLHKIYLIKGLIESKRRRYSMESFLLDEINKNTSIYEDIDSKHIIRTNHKFKDERIQNEFVNLSALVKEAEVLLGKDSKIVDASKQLESCYRGLYAVTTDYLGSLNVNNVLSDENFVKLKRQVYAKGNKNGEDKVQNSLNTVVKLCEESLEKYLRK